MHANLMRATSNRHCANQTEFVDCWGATPKFFASNAAAASLRAARWFVPSTTLFETSRDAKFGLRRRTCRMNHLFQPDLGFWMLALLLEGSVDDSRLPFGPAPHHRQ